jgi:hypothetical protein
MKTVLRLINIIFAPILTLLFVHAIARKMASDLADGKDISQALGGAAAGATVLTIELFLGKGPKFFRFARRWLDPRAAFEGMWIQRVYAGHAENRYACLAIKYDRHEDNYSVTGNAYSESGQRSRKFRSTHVFFTAGEAKVDYLWDGEIIGRDDQPELEKHGLTKLTLRDPGVFKLPVSGDGAISHLDEKSKLAFTLTRVTNQTLRELNLNFDLTDLLLDGKNEEFQLVQKLLAEDSAKKTSSMVSLLGAGVTRP